MGYGNKYEFKASEVAEELVKWIKNYYVYNVFLTQIHRN